MKLDVKKAIFPIAGLGTRFLPLSKTLSKEMIPLLDKPLVQYSVKEAYDSGIKEIQFVTRPKQKEAIEYFSKNKKLEDFLTEKGKKEELELLRSVTFNMDFSSVVQKVPAGDASAIYQAKSFAGKDPCGVFFCDDVVYSEDPGFSQLVEVFKNCQCPVLGLKKLPADKLHSYGVIEGDKIANGFYKVKKIIQKPKSGETDSDLAILGRMILTSDVFDYMTKYKKLLQKDFGIVQILGMMVNEGKPVYGYEIKGDWLECGSRSSWLRSFLSLLLKDPKFGPETREFLKSIKL
ncbi:MAG: sugar phosphate nucleotidyltransferase [Candidatus Pacebacteria bacterium]|nr:sugar phosphate nucleotidyltransferase [Candidatus Paceibacterota bacterium]